MMAVALLAEGVDRNSDALRSSYRMGRSPSSRRAWIEIREVGKGSPRASVALLAEGVDRNLCRHTVPPDRSESPSSRRAWIEIKNLDFFQKI